MKKTFPLRVRVIDRLSSPLPEDDGEALVEVVRSSLLSGGAPPVATVVRPARTELLELAMINAQGLTTERFLAGLSRSGMDEAAPRAVGVVGRFRMRVKQGEPVPIALVFLEWSDCSWWMWRGLLDPHGALQPDTEIRRSARAGDPLPRGLGRWWSRGRRTGVRFEMGPVHPGIEASPLVH